MNMLKQFVARRFVVVLMAGLLSATAWGRNPRLAPDLSPDDSNDLVNVIVQFKQTPGEVHKDKIRRKDGSVASELPLVKALSGRLPKNRLSELANDPEVSYISPDRPVHSYLNNAAAAVNAPVAWAQATRARRMHGAMGCMFQASSAETGIPRRASTGELLPAPTS